MSIARKSSKPPEAALTSSFRTCQKRRRDGSTQSPRPYEMGGLDELLQGAGGGNREV